MTAGRITHVPPRPFTPLSAAGPCRFCGDLAFLADDTGPLHPCCEMWAAELAAGRPCPACSESRRRKR